MKKNYLEPLGNRKKGRESIFRARGVNQIKKERKINFNLKIYSLFK